VALEFAQRVAAFEVDIDAKGLFEPSLDMDGQGRRAC